MCEHGWICDKCGAKGFGSLSFEQHVGQAHGDYMRLFESLPWPLMEKVANKALTLEQALRLKKKEEEGR